MDEKLKSNYLPESVKEAKRAVLEHYEKDNHFKSQLEIGVSNSKLILTLDYIKPEWLDIINRLSNANGCICYACSSLQCVSKVCIVISIQLTNPNSI